MLFYTTSKHIKQIFYCIFILKCFLHKKSSKQKLVVYKKCFIVKMFFDIKEDYYKLIYCNLTYQNKSNLHNSNIN